MAAVLLGINIDHVATVRQARRAPYPNVADAARAALDGGADFITVHLREDRRHIVDDDLPPLMETTAQHNRYLNLEIAATDEMQAIALNLRPRSVCIVPENRQEVTTEGGLAVAAQTNRLRDFCAPLIAAGIEVSLFIDPDSKQIEASAAVGAPTVELHTGDYARSGDVSALQAAVAAGAAAGLKVNAGHGLHYDNVQPLMALPIVEFNIGHAVVARAVFCGLTAAVQQMRAAMKI